MPVTDGISLPSFNLRPGNFQPMGFANRPRPVLKKLKPKQ